MAPWGGGAVTVRSGSGMSELSWVSSAGLFPRMRGVHVTNLLGSLLPLALAVAVSPVAVHGVLRMTFSAPPSFAPDWGFVIGWGVGLVAVTGLSALLTALVTGRMTGTGFSVVAGLLLLALGALAWNLALRRWRARPRPGEPARWPSWVRTAAEADPARAAGLGFALAALDLKNLALAGSAGAFLALARVSFGATVLSLLVFVVLSSVALLVVTVGFRVARSRVGRPLERLLDGLELNLGGVEPAALLVAGGLLVGTGIATF